MSKYRKWAWVFAIVVVLTVCEARTEGQQAGKIPLIAFLAVSGDRNNPGPWVEAFRQGLRDLGYTERKNVLVEYRYSEGKLDRIPSLVRELLQLKPDILVLVSISSIRAAKQLTKTIPIVIVTTLDPVAAGIVDSLARPGGNITGVTRLTRDLGGKRLELLKEVVPKLSRVGVLWQPDDPGAALAFKEYDAAARALKIQLQSLEVRGPNPDLEGAFQMAAKGRVNALIMVTGVLLSPNTKRIADLAIKNQLPSMGETSRYVDTGGLVVYSTNDADTYRRAAYYVDKILKGAKPGDLPIEQPTKFELAINLKTAKALNLTIPPSVLYRADKVIR